MNISPRILFSGHKRAGQVQNLDKSSQGEPPQSWDNVPTREAQLAKKPVNADTPSDIHEHVPSDRPLMETADGEIRKRYTPEEIGRNQFEIEKAKGGQKFQIVMNDSNTVLFTAKTVFPLDLFPDSISIDLARVNVITRNFFWSARIHSIDVVDISDVAVDTGPFFSQLILVAKSGIDRNLVIKNLWTNTAVKLRRIIHGLILMNTEGVNIRTLDNTDLLKKIEEIGSIKQA